MSIFMMTNGVLVIELDPNAQNVGQAFLLAMTSAMACLSDETFAEIEHDMAVASQLEKAGDPSIGPHYRVTRTAWAAIQEVRDEYRLVEQETRD